MPNKPNVLIVDDDYEFSKLLIKDFTEAGFAAMSCAKVSHAMQKLNNQEFSCILLDLQLQSEPGGEFIINSLKNKQATKLDYNAQTPIVIVSGHFDKDLVDRVKDKISGLYVKPFNHDDLIKHVQTLHDRKESQQG